MENKPKRIVGLDVCRAVAIAGMALIHFALVLSSSHIEGTTSGEFINRLSGRPATIFMILAGIGVSLRLRGREEDRTAQSKVRRSLILRGIFFLLFGYLNLVFWPGDILRVYGIAYLAAAFLLTARSAWLWATAVSVVGLFTTLMFVIDFETNWNFATMEYANLWTVSGGLLNLFFNGFRAVLPWMGLLVFGMLMGRLDLTNTKTRSRIFWAGIVVWLGTELFSTMLIRGVHGVFPTADKELIFALLGTDSLPPMPLFLLSSSGLALATICGCIWLAELPSIQPIIKSFASAGQLAFTWYVAHIVIVIAAGVVTGFAGSTSMYACFLVSFVFLLVMLMSSQLYRARFQFGPLEYLLRTVTS